MFAFSFVFRLSFRCWAALFDQKHSTVSVPEVDFQRTGTTVCQLPMGGAGCGATAIVCPDGQRKHSEQIARKALHIRP